MKQIYIHGLGQTSNSWNKVIEQLEDVEYSICPDLAELVQGQEITYQNLYAAFSTMCDAIEGDISLCGLSLGGVLALNYAIEHSEKVKSLVLIAIQYKMPKKLLQFQNVIFRFMPKSVFQQTGFGKADFLKLCSTMMELDFSDLIYKVTCPTLVLYGEKDRANKNASIELANILTNAELQVIHGAGHEINIEAPEQLVEALRNFF
ncbi:MAG: alpha/beta hydrolase [Lachnospiraceae bacterium]|nr:alpha/beta hydrolase [Lachnospiraceae bacterium]